MLGYYYRDDIKGFLNKNSDQILGELINASLFDVTLEQRNAWEEQIRIMKNALSDFKGEVFFEFSIPRMGKRVDVLVIIQNIVFVVEFKVGGKKFNRYDIDQVWDYALDLKNFHKPSHSILLVPVLVATKAKSSPLKISLPSHDDKLLNPLLVIEKGLLTCFQHVLEQFGDKKFVEGEAYARGSYAPTPTIIEAALSLYNDHSVDEITKSDASAKNLADTTEHISRVIESARIEKKKVICFVTGVPGAGKTLVGLNIATQHMDNEGNDASVYLSGNGPLVQVLQEALTRDRVEREKEKGNKLTKKKARSSVKTFIQNVHHYRDEYIRDKKAPVDHVAIFDEAQRAWTKEKTVSFMKSRKGIESFDYSEPEFLISCLNRHNDWAVIVCLVGGGQEINTGEAGISEWLKAIKSHFNDWVVHISPNLTESEYDAVNSIEELESITEVSLNKDLHLSVSMRSYRAENLSTFVKLLLDRDIDEARKTLNSIPAKYPIVLTRDIEKAKIWLKSKSRGSERYGLVVSSQAERLKPLAVDVKSNINPIHWFLNGKDDVRSSYFLEQVATEFHIQGLELDWAGLVWDGDLRYSDKGWKFHSFRGSKWTTIRKEERKNYLLNAYRVLLTRARQGMVIVIPKGDPDDHTRKAEYYDPTFKYLSSLGIETI